MSKKATSLKQLFQQMIPETIGLTVGLVIKTDPIIIQVINNPKMILSGSNLVIPKHLSNYKTQISFDNPNIKNLVKPYSLDDVPGADYKLTFQEPTINEVTIYNALKKGEKVYLLRFNGGELYYVLDRVVS